MIRQAKAAAFFLIWIVNCIISKTWLNAAVHKTFISLETFAIHPNVISHLAKE